MKKYLRLMNLIGNPVKKYLQAMNFIENSKKIYLCSIKIKGSPISKLGEPIFNKELQPY